jgi:hypothetical protein
MGSQRQHLRKRYRLALRGSICLVILLLPLAHRLNSLQLIALVAALLWFIVAVETWGNAEACHVWIGEKKGQQYICKYNFKCVQGEENIPDGLVLDEDAEEGDIMFGV